jgi:hypothetical protein
MPAVTILPPSLHIYIYIYIYNPSQRNEFTSLLKTPLAQEGTHCPPFMPSRQTALYLLQNKRKFIMMVNP